MHCYSQTQPMAYLGFQKGGPNIRWPLVFTQRGVKPSFLIFYYVEKQNFCQRGAMADLAKG